MKFYVFVSILFVASILNGNAAADDDTDRTEFHNQINDHIGELQLNVRSMLNDVRLKRMTIETENHNRYEQITTNIKQQFDKSTNEANNIGASSSSSSCANEAKNQTQQLLKHGEEGNNECISQAKATESLAYKNLVQRTSALADLQVQIGEKPQQCWTEEALLQKRVDCVKRKLEVIKTEAIRAKEQIDQSVNVEKGNFRNIYSTLESCLQVQLNSVREQLKSIQDHLNQCNH